MPFDRDRLLLAVATNISVEVALRLDRAWEAFAPQPMPDDNDNSAGLAIAIASSSLPAEDAATQIAALGIYAARIEGEHAGTLFLNGTEALTHPLLARWIGATFADTVGEALSAGRLGTNLAPDSPLFQRFELHEVSGVIVHATAYLRFDLARTPVDVKVEYGAPSVSNFLRCNVMSGDAIYEAGAALRADGAGEEPPPPTPCEPPSLTSYKLH
jgi:hypothetical protein